MVEGKNRPGKNRTPKDDLAAAAAIPLEQLAAPVVTVDGQACYAGKLSINQIIAAAKLLVETAAKLSEESRKTLRAAATTAAAPGASQEDTLGNLALGLAVLDEEVVGRLFSIVVRQPPAWCSEHIGIGDLARIVDSLLDNNEIDTVRAVFFRQSKRFAASLNSTPR